MSKQAGYDSSDIIDISMLNSQQLESAYHQTLHDTDTVLQAENIRRLQVQQLLLELDNYDIHQQLRLEGDRVKGLEQEKEKLRAHLRHVQEDARQNKTDLRYRLRDLHHMKAELDSLNGVNVDATKLLTQKLSLARELSTTKPELEHLRSQAAHQQATLMEKLLLERQVSMLKVELETEKRASKHAATLSDQCRVKEVELEQQVGGLQRELAKAQREIDRTRRDAERESDTWEGRKTFLERKVDQLKRLNHKSSDTEENSEAQETLSSLMAKLDEAKQINIDMEISMKKERQEGENQQTLLEGKLEDMRLKLKVAKQELKHNKGELATLHASDAGSAATQSWNESRSRFPQKRAAFDIDAVGTPNIVTSRVKRPARKHARPDQPMVGDKSMFSITPYLNRTASTVAENPTHDLEDIDDDERTRPDESAAQLSLDPALIVPPILPLKTIAKGRKQEQREMRKCLTQASGNTSNRGPDRGKLATMTTLDKVAEEEVNDENGQINAGKAPTSGTSGGTRVQHKNAIDTGPLKKKRKLYNGGSTLFDDEDDGRRRRPVKATIVPTSLKIRETVARENISQQKGLEGRAGVGEFSPLKRDRRGFCASFLP